jgi:proline iminopeptidase
MVYPDIEPYEGAMLDVGDGNDMYWEASGNPRGHPVVVVHGGPGSGCTPWHRRLFDPTVYRMVAFDQRGCGRSTPHASTPDIDLTTNTTQSLVADLERLRQHLEVDRWLVWGGSWGSTLAYAETHPGRVSAMILWGITTGRPVEFDWLFRGGLAPLFPEQWERFCAGSGVEPGGAIVAGYSRLLRSPDPGACRRAAHAWCMWESATPDCPPTTSLAERYRDPNFALAFARLVTHYVRHDAFLDDGILLRGVTPLNDIPAILINGRFDLQAPLGNASALHLAWPTAQLVVVEEAEHAADDAKITREVILASDRLPTAR